jgi:hypothetical protein
MAFSDAADFRSLCYHIGLGLVTWQRVEDVHFKIFLRMLNVPLIDVSSVAYYSLESFDARNTTLDRMAHYFLAPKQLKQQRIKWQGLHKRLKDGNLNRNKLAHYSVDYDLINMREMPDGSVVFDVTPHSLRPARWNFVSRLLGRTPDKEDHNLGADQIKRYIIDFRQLVGEMELFHVSIGQPSEAGLLPAPPLPPDSTPILPPTLSKSPPEDGQPSGQ